MLHLTGLRAVFRLRSDRRMRRRPTPRNGFSLGGEVLERRLLLSASPAAEVSQLTAGDSDANLGGVGAVHEMQLRIVGTTIRFDEATGLPAYMAGEIYYSGGPRDGKLAGTYEEHLTPIMHPEYGFIGTIGVSTFRFHNANGKTTFGEVTTVNQSFMTGYDENGAICVASTGEITGGTRRLGHVTGGISSSSAVVLGPSFSMEVNLTLQFQNQPQGAGQAGGVDAGATAASHGKHAAKPSRSPGHPHFEPASSALDHAFASWDDELAPNL